MIHRYTVKVIPVSQAEEQITSLSVDADDVKIGEEGHLRLLRDNELIFMARSSAWLTVERDDLRSDGAGMMFSESPQVASLTLEDLQANEAPTELPETTAPEIQNAAAVADVNRPRRIGL